MDCKKKIVVCGASHRICEEQEPKREWMRMPKLHGHKELQGHDRKDDEFGERFVAHEFDDVWMGLQDGHSPRAVWLLCHQPEKIRRVLGWPCVGAAVVVAIRRRDDGASRGAFPLCERLCTAKVTEIYAMLEGTTTKKSRNERTDIRRLLHGLQDPSREVLETLSD